jgi:molybdate transport system permease protein
VSLKVLTVASAVAVSAFFGLLLVTVFVSLSPSEIGPILTSPRVLYSIRLSIVTATIATVLALAVGLPAAYALSRYEFSGKSFVDTLVEFPVILSPVALGAVLLLFLSTEAGMRLQESGVRLVFEIPGIILAQWTSVVGVAIRLMRAIFDEIPQRYENVARTLGATPGQAVKYVTLPLARRGLLRTALLVWAKALGEFGATITVAGAMAMKTETLPVAISNALSAAQIDQAVLLIALLATIGLVVLYSTRTLLAGRSQ